MNKIGLYFFCILLACPTILFAYNIEIGGVCYLLQENNAIVTYPNSSVPTQDMPSNYTGSVVIPQKITTGGKTYPVTAIGEKAFFHSTITSITLPEGLLTINRQALSFCKELKELCLPNSLTHIGFDAFAYNTSLSKVILGENIELIEQGAFYSSSVVNVYINTTTPPTISKYLFSSFPTLYVKANSIDQYKNSSWARFGSLIIDPDANYVYKDLVDLIDKYSTISYTIGTKPGQYTASKVKEFDAALNYAKTLDENSSPEIIKKTVKKIVNSIPSANQIITGYYRIVSAGKGKGYSGGPYDYEYKAALYNRNGRVCWSMYDPCNYNMIYKFTQKEEDCWAIYNPFDSSYIGKATANFSCSVATDTNPVVQKITHWGNGKYTIQNVDNSYVFSLTNSHNGCDESTGTLNVWGTSQEATQYGINLWYLELVPEDYVNILQSKIPSGNNIEDAIELYGTLNGEIIASNDPGCHKKENIDNYSSALADVKALTGTEAASQIQSAITKLKVAYNQVLTSNPIRPGFYNIVTAGNGTGYSGGPYNYEGKSAIYNKGNFVKWKPYDSHDFNLIYYLSEADSQNWNVFSVIDQTYINKGAKTYSTPVSTSADPITSQNFTFISEAKFSIGFNSNPYVYSVVAGHNGTIDDNGYLNIWGTPSEAKKYGVNVWYLKTVSENVLNDFFNTREGALAKCLDYENKANSMIVGTEPGFFFKEKVLAFKRKINEAKTALSDDHLTVEQRQLTLKSLEDEYIKAQETVPITDGYYYIVNKNERYIKQHGNKAALYTAPYYLVSKNNSACFYDTFNKNNANYIFKITKEYDRYIIENAYTHFYLNLTDGNVDVNDILNCTENFAVPQKITWLDSGSFSISDTSNCYNIVLADTVSYGKRDFILTDFVCNNTNNNINAWGLLPLTQNEVKKIIEAQSNTDAATTKAYNDMVSYQDSVQNTYNKIVNNIGNKYNIDAITELKSKNRVVDNYIKTHDCDIITTSKEYSIATTELKEAIECALESKPDDHSALPLQGKPIGALSVDYSSNQSSTTVNTPNDAFDDDFTTIYASYERSTGFVGLDLGKPHVITKVAYAPRQDWAKRMVLGVFEGANKPDFSDAIPFYVIKEIPEYSKITYAKVNCSRGFRYVRYVGPNDARCNISELRFYGTEGCGDDSRLYQMTNLPLVVIRTTANIPEVTSKTTWQEGHINIIFEKGTALKTDSVSIRGRGNGSWTFEKKPYKIKLQNKSRILGMPAKAKEWTLINNYGDKSLIRNNVAFCLSRIFEMKYTPACSLVDVIFNGQYKGSYQLCDQIEVRKNRVDITEMTTQDDSDENLTGGYLIEIDAYAGSEPKHFNSKYYNIPVTVHYPKNDIITTRQFSYIQEAFNQLCASVNSSLYKSESSGYKKYLDETSWLKYFLIEELSGNTDGYWSVYMAKDRNDVFRVYPVWDFDLAFDNDRRTHPILTMTDFLSLNSKSSAANGVRSFNRKIVESCSNELKELWSWYRYKGNLTYEYISAVVDSLGNENNLSQEYNYIRWPILNVCTQQQYIARGTYKAEVDFINEYLYDRIAWLDNKVGLEEPIGIHDNSTSELRGGIHGRVGEISVRGIKVNSAISIYNANGLLICNKVIKEFDNSFKLPKGMYIVKIKDNSGSVRTEKVAVR